MERGSAVYNPSPAPGTPLYLTPESLLDGACEYAAAADAVNDRQPQAWHVITHLLGMSVELALKALLLHHGYDGKALRKLGHDLKRLFDAGVKHGLKNSGSREFRILMHGGHYKSRLFAYPANGTFGTILPWGVRELAQGIILEVFLDLHGSDALETSRSKPGLSIASKYERHGLLA